jgi:hypothetical protein
MDELAAQQDVLAGLRREQTGILAQLSAFPRYTALAIKRIPLPDMQAALLDGEAYYKLVAAGQDLYGLYATSRSARLFALPLSRDQLAREVQKIRDSIVTIENGRAVNRPFDLDRSRALYKALLGPVDADLPGVRHLVFEPDAAMLQAAARPVPRDPAGPRTETLGTSVIFFTDRSHLRYVNQKIPTKDGEE